ncbi:methyltransferase domain-containing protein [bacterium]|nr:methyltransferase domain-containing protein [bacterium]
MIRKIKKAGILIRHIAGYDPAHHAQHDYEYKFIRVKDDLSALIEKPLGECRLLVYGCGYHYPEVALFARETMQAEGIDTAHAFYRDRLVTTAADIVQSDPGNPLFALVKAWLKKNYYYRRYFGHLQKIAGRKFRHRDYKLTSYNGKRLPYPDNAFDVVISNSVLEHVDDLENGFRELSRVTRPGGITYHLWHNFYSFSGGHTPLSVTRAHPWGHVLGTVETPYLNRKTPDEIKSAMALCFDLVSVRGIDRSYRKQGTDADFTYEEETLLTDELMTHLPDLPKEWFLTTAYLIVGRRK